MFEKNLAPIEDNFKAMFKVTKDLGAIRKKGVMIEDIAQRVRELNGNFNTVQRQIVSYSLFLSEGFSMNDDGSVGVYSYAGRDGIPTYVVGIQSEKVWRGIRAILRTEGLVR